MSDVRSCKYCGTPSRKGDYCSAVCQYAAMPTYEDVSLLDNRSDDDRHEAIPQPGCNMCVCGLPVTDDSAHLRVDR